MPEPEDLLDLKSLLIPAKKALRNPLSLLISTHAGEEEGWQEKYGRDEAGNLIVTDPEKRVQNFWHWFGESKVVDEGGNPKVMWHRGHFDESDNPIPLTGSGMHFGTSRIQIEPDCGSPFNQESNACVGRSKK